MTTQRIKERFQQGALLSFRYLNLKWKFWRSDFSAFEPILHKKKWYLINRRLADRIKLPAYAIAAWSIQVGESETNPLVLFRPAFFICPLSRMDLPRSQTKNAPIGTLALFCGPDGLEPARLGASRCQN